MLKYICKQLYNIVLSQNMPKKLDPRIEHKFGLPKQCLVRIHRLKLKGTISILFAGAVMI